VVWNAVMAKGAEQWLHYFHLERRLDRKAQLLVTTCPNADTGTLAVEQLLAQEPKERAAAFALAAFPAAAAGRLRVGAEGINDLGRLAQDLLTVDGEIRWQERISTSGTTHPELVTISGLLSGLEPARLVRAKQLLYYCIVHNLTLADPRAFEEEFDRSVRVFGGGGAA